MNVLELLVKTVPFVFRGAEGRALLKKLMKKESVEVKIGPVAFRAFVRIQGYGDGSGYGSGGRKASIAGGDE